MRIYRGVVRPGGDDRAREGHGGGGAHRERYRVRPLRRRVRSDIARAINVEKRIESGICQVNGLAVHDEVQMPFGGTKGSGYGRLGGKAAIDEFTELRWITVQTGRGIIRFELIRPPR